MRWLQVLPRVGSFKAGGLAEVLVESLWFIMEYWRADGRIRVYLLGQVPEGQLRRHVGVRRAEPPGLEGLYVAEVRQPGNEWWEPLEASGIDAVFDWLCEGCGVQIAAWRDHRAVKALQGKARELRGSPPGIASAIVRAALDEFNRATRPPGSPHYDPYKAERLQRLRAQGEEELKRRKAGEILERLRQGPIYIVRVRAYAPEKSQARELAELLATRFSRPLTVKAPGLLSRPLDSKAASNHRRPPSTGGLLSAFKQPDKTLLWMTSEELKTLIALPDPSLHKADFERGSPLPEMAPARRGDVRLGRLQDGTPFHIDLEDLYRHVWVIGMTGTGKSTFLWNLALRLHATRRAAVVVIDPHGDLSLDILESVESLEGVHLLDPVLRPFGLNPLDLPRARDRGHAVALAVDQLIAIFEKVLRLPETAVNVRYLLQVLLRMFYERTDNPTLGDLYNAIVALKTGELDLPVDDPQWRLQVELLQGLQEQTFLSALSRLEPYASNPLLRRVTSRTTVDLDELLRPGSLVIFRLPKGELGEGVLQLLAPAIVLKLWFYVLERAMLGRERTPIFVVVDEFQNIAGLPVVETILSEARKYGLHLVMAHQHTKQLPEELLQSVFSNTAVKVVFQVGGGDVQRLGQLDRDFADAVRRALTALTIGQAVVKLTARPGEQQPPPTVVTMDPPPPKRRSWREALASLPQHRPPADPGERSPEELLNPVLKLLPPPSERLAPEEQLVLYRIWRASRAGREVVEWSRVLAGLGLRRQRAEEARDSLAARGLIEAYKEGNRWLARYVKGLFAGLKAVAPSREGRRIAAKAMLWYLERGYYVSPARQAGPARPDLVAIPYDRAQLRLRYSEAVAIEIESCGEVESHPEQVARNLVKGWELIRQGVVKRVDFWTAEGCAQRLKSILDEAATQNRVPREAYSVHTARPEQRREEAKHRKPREEPEEKTQATAEARNPEKPEAEPREDTVEVEVEGRRVRLARSQYREYKRLLLLGWKPSLTENGEIQLTGPKGQTKTLKPANSGNQETRKAGG